MLKIKFALLIFYFSAISTGLWFKKNVKYSLKEVKQNKFCKAENIALLPGMIKMKETTDIKLKDVQKDVQKLLDSNTLSTTVLYAKGIIEILMAVGTVVAASVVPILGMVALILTSVANDKHDQKFDKINRKIEDLTNIVNKRFIDLRNDITISTSTLERSILFGEINQMIAFQSNCNAEKEHKEECLRNAERYIQSAFKKMFIYYKEVQEKSGLTDEQLDRIKLSIIPLTEYLERLYLPIKIKNLWLKGNNDETKSVYDDFVNDIKRIDKYLSNAGEMITDSHKSNDDQLQEINDITYQFKDKEITPKINDVVELLTKDKISTLECEARFDRRLVDKCEVEYNLVYTKVQDASKKEKKTAWDYIKLSEKEKEALRTEGWNVYDAKSWEELCGSAMQEMYKTYSSQIAEQLKEQWQDKIKRIALLQLLKKLIDENTLKYIKMLPETVNKQLQKSKEKNG